MNFTQDANGIYRLNTSPTGDAGIAIDTSLGAISALITTANNAISSLNTAINGALLAAHNLSDVANAATARSNLGLLSAATHASTDFDAAGSAATVNTALTSHTSNVSNPHSTTAAQVGAPPTSRTISTSGSLSGGGDLSANRTIAVTIPTPLRVTFDGGGSAITTGSGTKVNVVAPISGTITSNTMLADQSGSCVIGISKSNFAGFPGSLTSIVASAPPTLSSSQKSTDSALTGWSTSVTAGDILQFSVTSATTVQRVTVSLQIVGA